MTIRLLKTYLHHDIRQLVSRYAEARYQDPVQMTNALLPEGDASSEQLLQRYCHTGVGFLRGILRKYLENRNEDWTDTLAKNDAWEFVFKDAGGLDGDALAETMHWFIVKHAMLQWLLAYAPAESSATKAELDGMKEELTRGLRTSGMPMKVHRLKHDTNTEIVFTYEPKE